MKKGVQFFSEEYLKRCEGVTPDQIIEFLENYRMLISKERMDSSLHNIREGDLRCTEPNVTQ